MEDKAGALWDFLNGSIDCKIIPAMRCILPSHLCDLKSEATPKVTTSEYEQHRPLLLTWFNFNPRMDK